MYRSGQVIYDLDKNKLITLADAWNGAQYPKNSTHVICSAHNPIFVGNKNKDIFKCNSCGYVDYFARNPNYEHIYIGEGTGKKRLAIAQKLLDAGSIKPAQTLEQVLANKIKRDQGDQAIKELSPEERAEQQNKSSRAYFIKGFKDVKLRFYRLSPYGNDDAVYARDSQILPEYKFRDPHNIRVMENARKEYLLGIKELRNKLSAKYNPQFTEEDPNQDKLPYPERKAAFDDVWNTPELIALYYEHI